jgi:hypothetical protein
VAPRVCPILRAFHVPTVISDLFPLLPPNCSKTVHVVSPRTRLLHRTHHSCSSGSPAAARLTWLPRHCDECSDSPAIDNCPCLQQRLVALFKHVPAPMMASVQIQRIARLKRLHHLGEVSLRRLQQQMDMIGQQTVTKRTFFEFAVVNQFL